MDSDEIQYKLFKKLQRTQEETVCSISEGLHVSSLGRKNKDNTVERNFRKNNETYLGHRLKIRQYDFI
jgi:hypothetical protein